MPTAPPRLCHRCHKLHSGPCPEAPVRTHERTTKERGYGADWQAFRKRRLTDQPLCEDCIEAGRVTPATEVHHLKKIKDRPDLRLVEENTRCLCSPCHKKRSARGE